MGNREFPNKNTDESLGDPSLEKGHGPKPRQINGDDSGTPFDKAPSQDVALQKRHRKFKRALAEIEYGNEAQGYGRMSRLGVTQVLKTLDGIFCLWNMGPSGFYISFNGLNDQAHVSSIRDFLGSASGYSLLEGEEEQVLVHTGRKININKIIALTAFLEYEFNENSLRFTTSEVNASGPVEVADRPQDPEEDKYNKMDESEVATLSASEQLNWAVHTGKIPAHWSHINSDPVHSLEDVFNRSRYIFTDDSGKRQYVVIYGNVPDIDPEDANLFSLYAQGEGQSLNRFLRAASLPEVNISTGRNAAGYVDSYRGVPVGDIITEWSINGRSSSSIPIPAHALTTFLKNLISSNVSIRDPGPHNIVYDRDTETLSLIDMAFFFHTDYNVQSVPQAQASLNSNLLIYLNLIRFISQELNLSYANVCSIIQGANQEVYDKFKRSYSMSDWDENIRIRERSHVFERNYIQARGGIAGLLKESLNRNVNDQVLTDEIYRALEFLSANFNPSNLAEFEKLVFGGRTISQALTSEQQEKLKQLIEIMRGKDPGIRMEVTDDASDKKNSFSIKQAFVEAFANRTGGEFKDSQGNVYKVILDNTQVFIICDALNTFLTSTGTNNLLRITVQQGKCPDPINFNEIILSGVIPYFISQGFSFNRINLVISEADPTHNYCDAISEEIISSSGLPVSPVSQRIDSDGDVIVAFDFNPSLATRGPVEKVRSLYEKSKKTIDDIIRLAGGPSFSDLAKECNSLQGREREQFVDNVLIGQKEALKSQINNLRGFFQSQNILNDGYRLDRLEEAIVKSLQGLGVKIEKIFDVSEGAAVSLDELFEEFIRIASDQVGSPKQYAVESEADFVSNSFSVDSGVPTIRYLASTGIMGLIHETGHLINWDASGRTNPQLGSPLNILDETVNQVRSIFIISRLDEVEEVFLNKEGSDPFADANSVGTHKPLASVEIMRIREHGKSVHTFREEMEAKGHSVIELDPDVSIIHGGAVFVYDYKALAELLNDNTHMLDLFGWPTTPYEFVVKVGSELVRGETPLYDLITKAFADLKNVGRTDDTETSHIQGILSGNFRLALRSARDNDELFRSRNNPSFISEESVNTPEEMLKAEGITLLEDHPDITTIPLSKLIKNSYRDEQMLGHISVYSALAIRGVIHAATAFDDGTPFSMSQFRSLRRGAELNITEDTLSSLRDKGYSLNPAALDFNDISVIALRALERGHLDAGQSLLKIIGLQLTGEALQELEKVHSNLQKPTLNYRSEESSSAAIDSGFRSEIPYYYTGIDDADLETARPVLQRQIAELLNSGNTVVVRAFPGIGKSTLIKSLVKGVYKDTKPLVLDRDLSDVPKDIASYLQKITGGNLEEIINNIRTFSGSPFEYLNNELLKQGLKVPVFFDRVYTIGSDLQALTSIANAADQSQLMVAYFINYVTEIEKHVKKVFGQFPEIILAPLDYSETEAFVRRPLEGTGVTFDNSAILRIYEYSGGRPEELGWWCFGLLSNFASATNITLKMVNDFYKQSFGINSSIPQLADNSRRNYIDRVLRANMSSAERTTMEIVAYSEGLHPSRIDPLVLDKLIKTGFLEKSNTDLIRVRGELFKNLILEDVATRIPDPLVLPEALNYYDRKGIPLDQRPYWLKGKSYFDLSNIGTIDEARFTVQQNSDQGRALASLFHEFITSPSFRYTIPALLGEIYKNTKNSFDSEQVGESHAMSNRSFVQQFIDATETEEMRKAFSLWVGNLSPYRYEQFINWYKENYGDGSSPGEAIPSGPSDPNTPIIDPNAGSLNESIRDIEESSHNNESGEKDKPPITVSVIANSLGEYGDLAAGARVSSLSLESDEYITPPILAPFTFSVRNRKVDFEPKEFDNKKELKITVFDNDLPIGHVVIKVKKDGTSSIIQFVEVQRVNGSTYSDRSAADHHASKLRNALRTAANVNSPYLLEELFIVGVVQRLIELEMINNESPIEIVFPEYNYYGNPNNKVTSYLHGLDILGDALLNTERGMSLVFQVTDNINDLGLDYGLAALRFIDCIKDNDHWQQYKEEIINIMLAHLPSSVSISSETLSKICNLNDIELIISHLGYYTAGYAEDFGVYKGVFCQEKSIEGQTGRLFSVPEIAHFSIAQALSNQKVTFDNPPLPETKNAHVDNNAEQVLSSSQQERMIRGLITGYQKSKTMSGKTNLEEKLKKAFFTLPLSLDLKREIGSLLGLPIQEETHPASNEAELDPLSEIQKVIGLIEADLVNSQVRLNTNQEVLRQEHNSDGSSKTLIRKSISVVVAGEQTANAQVQIFELVRTDSQGNESRQIREVRITAEDWHRPGILHINELGEAIKEYLKIKGDEPFCMTFTDDQIADERYKDAYEKAKAGLMKAMGQTERTLLNEEHREIRHAAKVAALGGNAGYKLLRSLGVTAIKLINLKEEDTQERTAEIPALPHILEGSSSEPSGQLNNGIIPEVLGDWVEEALSEATESGQVVTSILGENVFVISTPTHIEFRLIGQPSNLNMWRQGNTLNITVNNQHRIFPSPNIASILAQYAAGILGEGINTINLTVAQVGDDFQATSLDEQSNGWIAAISQGLNFVPQSQRSSLQETAMQFKYPNGAYYPDPSLVAATRREQEPDPSTKPLYSIYERGVEIPSDVRVKIDAEKIDLLLALGEDMEKIRKTREWRDLDKKLGLTAQQKKEKLLSKSQRVAGENIIKKQQLSKDKVEYLRSKAELIEQHIKDEIAYAEITNNIGRIATLNHLLDTLNRAMRGSGGFINQVHLWKKIVRALPDAALWNLANSPDQLIPDTTPTFNDSQLLESLIVTQEAIQAPIPAVNDSQPAVPEAKDDRSSAFLASLIHDVTNGADLTHDIALTSIWRRVETIFGIASGPNSILLPETVPLGLRYDPTQPVHHRVSGKEAYATIFKVPDSLEGHPDYSRTPGGILFPCGTEESHIAAAVRPHTGWTSGDGGLDALAIEQMIGSMRGIMAAGLLNSLGQNRLTVDQKNQVEASLRTLFKQYCGGKIDSRHLALLHEFGAFDRSILQLDHNPLPLILLLRETGEVFSSELRKLLQVDRLASPGQVFSYIWDKIYSNSASGETDTIAINRAKQWGVFLFETLKGNPRTLASDLKVALNSRNPMIDSIIDSHLARIADFRDILTKSVTTLSEAYILQKVWESSWDATAQELGLLTSTPEAHNWDNQPTEKLDPVTLALYQKNVSDSQIKIAEFLPEPGLQCVEAYYDPRPYKHELPPGDVVAYFMLFERLREAFESFPNKKLFINVNNPSDPSISFGIYAPPIPISGSHSFDLINKHVKGLEGLNISHENGEFAVSVDLDTVTNDRQLGVFTAKIDRDGQVSYSPLVFDATGKAVAGEDLLVLRTQDGSVVKQIIVVPHLDRTDLFHKKIKESMQILYFMYGQQFKFNTGNFYGDYVAAAAEMQHIMQLEEIAALEKRALLSGKELFELVKKGESLKNENEIRRVQDYLREQETTVVTNQPGYRIIFHRRIDGKWGRAPEDVQLVETQAATRFLVHRKASLSAKDMMRAPFEFAWNIVKASSSYLLGSLVSTIHRVRANHRIDTHIEQVRKLTEYVSSETEKMSSISPGLTGGLKIAFTTLTRTITGMTIGERHLEKVRRSLIRHAETLTQEKRKLDDLYNSWLTRALSKRNPEEVEETISQAIRTSLSIEGFKENTNIFKWAYTTAAEYLTRTLDTIGTIADKSVTFAWDSFTTVMDYAGRATEFAIDTAGSALEVILDTGGKLIGGIGSAASLALSAAVLLGSTATRAITEGIKTGVIAAKAIGDVVAGFAKDVTVGSLSIISKGLEIAGEQVGSAVEIVGKTLTIPGQIIGSIISGGEGSNLANLARSRRGSIPTIIEGFINALNGRGPGTPEWYDVESEMSYQYKNMNWAQRLTENLFGAGRHSINEGNGKSTVLMVDWSPLGKRSRTQPTNFESKYGYGYKGKNLSEDIAPALMGGVVAAIQKAVKGLGWLKTEVIEGVSAAARLWNVAGEIDAEARQRHSKYRPIPGAGQNGPIPSRDVSPGISDMISSALKAIASGLGIQIKMVPSTTIHLTPDDIITSSRNSTGLVPRGRSGDVDIVAAITNDKQTLHSETIARINLANGRNPYSTPAFPITTGYNKEGPSLRPLLTDYANDDPDLRAFQEAASRGNVEPIVVNASPRYGRANGTLKWDIHYPEEDHPSDSSRSSQHAGSVFIDNTLGYREITDAYHKVVGYEFRDPSGAWIPFSVGDAATRELNDRTSAAELFRKNFRDDQLGQMYQSKAVMEELLSRIVSSANPWDNDSWQAAMSISAQIELLNRDIGVVQGQSSSNVSWSALVHQRIDAEQRFAEIDKQMAALREEIDQLGTSLAARQALIREQVDEAYKSSR